MIYRSTNILSIIDPILRQEVPTHLPQPKHAQQVNKTKRHDPKQRAISFTLFSQTIFFQIIKLITILLAPIKIIFVVVNIGYLVF